MSVRLASEAYCTSQQTECICIPALALASRQLALDVLHVLHVKATDLVEAAGQDALADFIHLGAHLEGKKREAEEE